MNLFKYRQFKEDIITWGVRWYCSYGISYRELKTMMKERGVCVDHTTIYRWIIFYAPKLIEMLKEKIKPYQEERPRLEKLLRISEELNKVEKPNEYYENFQKNNPPK